MTRNADQDAFRQLHGDFRRFARRSPRTASVVGGMTAALGLVGLVAMGPWWPVWYPGLVAVSLLLLGIGASAIFMAARAAAVDPEALVGAFLREVTSVALPAVACLACPRMLELGRCERCGADAEIFELRSEADRRLVLARFPASPHA